MQYWLIKSEPFKYPWEQLVADKQTFWNGVRNYQARNNLMAMKEGDLLLYYHSNEGKNIVGVAKVVKEHYSDTTTDEQGWFMIDVAPVHALKKPVSLSTIKTDKILQSMALVRQGRLSVCPVTQAEFDRVMELGM